MVKLKLRARALTQKIFGFISSLNVFDLYLYYLQSSYAAAQHRTPAGKKRPLARNNRVAGSEKRPPRAGGLSDHPFGWTTAP